MKQAKNSGKRSTRAHSRASWILSSLTEPLDLIFSRGVHPSMVLRHGTDGTYAILEAKERRLRKQEFDRLRRKNLIETKQEGHRLSVALTEAGKQELFRLKVLESDLLGNDRVCMVVFDIPEQYRKIRRRLRDFLTEAGFVPIQRSVWISPFNAAEPLRDLFRSTGATKWIRIYMSEQVH